MKKTAALLLSLVMLLSAVPAFAAEDYSPSIADEETVYVSSDRINKGETAVLHAYVQDKQGVQSVYVYYRMPEPQYGIIPFEMQPEDDGMYSLSFTAEDYLRSGEWNIAYFYVCDCEGNYTKLPNKMVYENTYPSYDYSGGNITVTGTAGDLEAPVLDFTSVKLTYANGESYAAPGETVILSVKLSDTAGVSRATASYTFSGEESVCLFEHNEKTGEYTAKITVPVNASAGIYKLNYIYAADILENNTSYAAAAGAQLSAGDIAVNKKEVVEPAKKPVVVLPAKTALVFLKGGTKSFTAKWKRVKGVTGYQLQYSKKKNFKGAETVNIKGAKNIKKTVKKLKGKKYYVRVRTYKKLGKEKYFSKWSKSKTVEL